MPRIRRKVSTRVEAFLRFWHDCSPVERGLLILAGCCALYVSTLYDTEVNWLVHWIAG